MTNTNTSWSFRFSFYFSILLIELFENDVKSVREAKSEAVPNCTRVEKAAIEREQVTDATLGVHPITIYRRGLCRYNKIFLTINF